MYGCLTPYNQKCLRYYDVRAKRGGSTVFPLVMWEVEAFPALLHRVVFNLTHCRKKLAADGWQLFPNTGKKINCKRDKIKLRLRQRKMKKFEYETIYDFDNLYQAYLGSRRSKRATREVVQFEMNAGPNICQMQEELRSQTYKLSGYYHFTIHDPKVREIYALYYRDRILQHSLCDNVLAPYFEKHLIYDNVACRTGKGTLFAMNRLNSFMHDHFRRYGTNGYCLKCDVRKFF